MKKIDSKQIYDLYTNADYFQVEKAINNLLNRPKHITINEREGGERLPLFINSFTPLVDGLGQVCGTVHPPRFCSSTEPGYTYELEFIQCPLNNLEESVSRMNLNYSLYDLGIELRWYNKWWNEIIIVPFKSPKDELLFWVIRTVSKSSLNYSYGPSIQLYNSSDIKSVFAYNNKYIYFVLSKEKPPFCSIEQKYAKKIKDTFNKISPLVGPLYENGFTEEKFLEFISSLEKPENLVQGLIDDTDNENLKKLCNLIVETKRREIQRALTLSYSSSSGGEGRH